LNRFYRATLCYRGICSDLVSVCLCVTGQCSIKTAKSRITCIRITCRITSHVSPCNSAGTPTPMPKV